MFKFIRSGEYGKLKREFPFEDASWPELIDEFQNFLEGCGYTFGNGFRMREILEEEHDLILQKMGINVKQLREDEHEWVE
jgi:hypothetical protein